MANKSPSLIPTLKTPLTYYGGKQTMLRHILPLIPEHQVYVEPFAGGAAVFWAKQPSPIEVINDRNGEIVNFYQTIQTNGEALAQLIAATPHSRGLHRKADFIYANPELFNPLERAWAVWVQCTMSFAAIIQGGYGYGRMPSASGKDTTTLRVANRREAWDENLETLKARLRLVQIEHNDALKVLQSRDSAVTFHYIDPPYINADQGHYKGYTTSDFTALLECLAQVKGKFLLSCYDGALLREHAKQNGWIVETHTKPLCAKKATHGGKRTSKIEVLARNYTL
jgi:DNA adenine methylase